MTTYPLALQVFILHRNSISVTPHQNITTQKVYISASKNFPQQKYFFKKLLYLSLEKLKLFYLQCIKQLYATNFSDKSFQLLKSYTSLANVKESRINFQDDKN